MQLKNNLFTTKYIHQLLKKRFKGKHEKDQNHV